MPHHNEHDPKNPTPSQPSKGGDDAPASPPSPPNPNAGLAREVGDLENPDAVDEDGALPGRMGGGLAGA